MDVRIRSFDERNFMRERGVAGSLIDLNMFLQKKSAKWLERR